MRLIVKTLSAFFCVALTSCSHHRSFSPDYEFIEGAYTVHGVTLRDEQLTTYSAVMGDKASRPRDYQPMNQGADPTFLFLRGDRASADVWLDEQCCSEQRSSRQTISDILTWGRTFLAPDRRIDIEIVLVPQGYRYAYATTYPVQSDQARARFAFHYAGEADRIAHIGSTLVHELTHIVLALDADRKPRNPISSETLATLAGVCSHAASSGTIPLIISNVDYGEAIIEDIRASDHASRIRGLSDNNPLVVAKTFAQFIVDEARQDTERHGGTVLERVIEVCETSFQRNHDFEESLFPDGLSWRSRKSD